MKKTTCSIGSLALIVGLMLAGNNLGSASQTVNSGSASAWSSGGGVTLGVGTESDRVCSFLTAECSIVCPGWECRDGVTGGGTGLIKWCVARCPGC